MPNRGMICGPLQVADEWVSRCLPDRLGLRPPPSFGCQRGSSLVTDADMAKKPEMGPFTVPAPLDSIEKAHPTEIDKRDVGTPDDCAPRCTFAAGSTESRP